jgi:hypothetical protein
MFLPSEPFVSKYTNVAENIAQTLDFAAERRRAGEFTKICLKLDEYKPYS